MKKIISLVIICAIILVHFSSCSSRPKINETPSFHATPSEIIEKLSYPNLIEAYQYIPLETNSKCIFGEIDDLLVANGLLYVISDGVYCFNMDGKLKFSINKKGHAQSEFVRVNSVSIKNNQLCIYDNSQWKVNVYDALTGFYKETIKLPYSAISVFGDVDKLLIDRSTLPCTEVPNDERFFVCSKKDPYEISGCYLPQEILKQSAHIQGTKTTTLEGYLCSEYWENRVWKITPEGVSCLFQIDLPANNSLSEKTRDYLSQAGQIQIADVPSEKYWGLTNVHESQDFIIGNLTCKGGQAFLVFDKTTLNSVVFKNISQVKDWQPLPISIRATDSEFFYSVIPADELCLVRDIKDSIDSPLESDMEYASYNIYKSIHESDNPVVIKYRIKHIE